MCAICCLSSSSSCLFCSINKSSSCLSFLATLISRNILDDHNSESHCSKEEYCSSGSSSLDIGGVVTVAAAEPSEIADGCATFTMLWLLIVPGLLIPIFIPLSVHTHVWIGD